MATFDIVGYQLSEALRLARRSGIRTFHTGAVIFDPRSGEALSNGWSHYSLRTPRKFRSIHAELHALIRAPKRDALRGSHIAVATIRAKSGNTGLARPCSLCTDLLYEVGVRRAFFTIEGTEWGNMMIRKEV